MKRPVLFLLGIVAMCGSPVNIARADDGCEWDRVVQSAKDHCAGFQGWSLWGQWILGPPHPLVEDIPPKYFSSEAKDHGATYGWSLTRTTAIRLEHAYVYYDADCKEAFVACHSGG
jgi:hypothetical protein